MLKVGSTEGAIYIADNDMASSFCIVEEDVFPEVFSTARMIALIERAGARALKPLLRPGQLSVGVTVNVKPLAAHHYPGKMLTFFLPCLAVLLAA